MLFSIFIIIVVGLVAYFHYVQGFFSATLSAIVSILAAAIAVSYYEPVMTKLLGGKFADVAPAMMLCILYAGTYILMRTVADTFVPGNLRLPVLADKVGAGVMGVVAGLFAGGIVALAGQSLPFGASVGGFSRFDTNEARDVQIPTSGQSQDTFVYEALKGEDIEKNRSENRRSLYVPADEVVLAAVQRLSNDGSLAGSQALATIHPDLTEELFLSNVGIQIGAKRTAVNIGKQQDVMVPGLFTVGSIPQTEGEMESIRKRALPAVLTPRPTDMILVVRAMFGRQATDSDNRMRFSPGSARLVAGGKDYYPLGTVERGNHLIANVLDDYLVTEAEKGADLLYVVPKADVLTDAKAAAGKQTIKEGVFVEVKRLGLVDLSGKKVATGITPSDEVQVIRKTAVAKNAAKAGGNVGIAPTPVEGAAAGPLSFDGVQADAKLPYPVNTGVPDKTVPSFQTTSAKGALAEGRFTKLEVDGTESVQRMGAGSYAIGELGAAAGQKVVKAHFTIAGDNPWAFESQIGNYQLADDKGTKYPPHGVVAKVKTSDGGDRMVARYEEGANVSDVPHVDGRPTDVWVVYCVPVGTQVAQMTFNGQSVGAASLAVQ